MVGIGLVGLLELGFLEYNCIVFLENNCIVTSPFSDLG